MIGFTLPAATADQTFFSTSLTTIAFEKHTCQQLGLCQSIQDQDKDLHPLEEGRNRSFGKYRPGLMRWLLP
ncbi:beta-galactosidase 8-like [Gossypium australe]|uniref:Beta-galactosidase 8-like n=1 Tax=Gossypium australe TaxID=47621 RepID=A0A5B6WCC8_9ROSI|nr:beta-galactosidase 8-like [Gossypium australe]